MLKRIWRHLITDHRSVRRRFPAAALAEVERLTREGERRHAGEVRLVIEPALPLGRVLQGLSPRERALEVFSLLRVWDTQDNCGVLVYLLLADRDVEIVADRGIHALVGQAEWERVCRGMEAHFRAGRFALGAREGVAEVSALLERHFPVRPGDRNELPDRPAVL